MRPINLHVISIAQLRQDLTTWNLLLATMNLSQLVFAILAFGIGVSTQQHAPNEKVSPYMSGLLSYCSDSLHRYVVMALASPISTGRHHLVQVGRHAS